MRRYRFACAVFVAALCYALWGLPPSPQPALAAEAGSTPGQLTILDREGKPAGLCPLQHTSVTADIAGYVARVTVQQQFHNPTKEPVEAVYTFPLPEDAAVDDMTMTLGRRVIKGQIKRREEARAIYEAARAAGQAAALLDQERPNIFTQSVANLMPGEKITITISYVNLLKYEEGRYEFVFPMVVGPRFIPGGGGYHAPGQRGAPGPVRRVEGDPGQNPVVTDAEKITPPITPKGTRAGHDISITVNLDAGLPLQDVRSALHRVTVQRQGTTRATIRLRNEKTIPNKDFILRYTAAGSHIQSGILTYAPGAKIQNSGGHPGGYFTLILQPPMAPPQSQITPKEMVFVIDQTGSQSGWPIKKAKEVMRYCIQNMNASDTFQLIGFNTEVYPCFPAPVPNTPENVAKALKFLEPLEGRGGTDILKSVDYALKIPDDPDRLRIICYMTDGYVGNDMQIIDYIQKNRGRARMFPFGIGNSVNRFLIEGMAREGRGAAEYVLLDTPGEDPSAKFYRRIASPLLRDIEIDWNGLPVEDVYPKHIPDVFSAAPIILKGRYTGPAEGDITVRGLLRGKPWSQTLHVILPTTDKDGSAIATLWARERIEDLQSRDWLGAQTGSPNTEITEQIIATALEYRLMSQHTSFVAVEQRIINIGGKTRRLDVPVEMPEGVAYEGIFGETRQERERLLRHGVQTGTQWHSASPPAAADKGRVMLRSQFGKSATGGFGGGRGPHPAAPARQTTEEDKAIGNLPRMDQLFEKEPNAHEIVLNIAEGKDAGLKKLDALKPEDRRALLEQIKLAPPLQKRLEEHRKARIQNPESRIEIQVWLNGLPKDGLKRLKTLGFDLAATLMPNRLLIGTITVDQLDALIELPFVRRVEPPRFAEEKPGT